MEARRNRQRGNGENRNREPHTLDGLDVAGAMFQTNYPRYNGRAAPLAYNEFEAKHDIVLTDLTPVTDEEERIAENPNLDLANLDPLQGGMQSDVFYEPQEGK